MELNKIYCGDNRVILRTFPANSIDCCITSPPYYSLRDYKIEPQIWGGDSACQHLWGQESIVKNPCGGWNDRDGPAKRRRYGMRTINPEKLQNKEASRGQFCQKCSAWRGSLGLEPHVDLYIQHLLGITLEIKRVLRPQGTFWLNIADTYCSACPGARDPQRWPKQSRNDHKPILSTYNRGVKSKDLFLVPARLSLGLQEQGWWVRQDIIWNKRNPMPESVTDRCTKSHEYVFLLTKSLKYFFDHKAIQEKAAYDGRKDTVMKGSLKYNRDDIVPGTKVHSMAARGHERWQRDEQGRYVRNKRSVWVTSAARFKGDHFATFPEALIEPMIKAGCPQGGVVMDTFMGTGTTPVAAKRLGRNYIGIDIKPTNVNIAIGRL